MAQFSAPARTFVRAEGNYLFDARGQRLFDAISSVWTIVHGHCHPHIVGAIAGQARLLDHSTLLGATHPKAEELAERLSDLTGLERAFFASDGASAVEASLKIALQYWQAVGQPSRTRFVHLVDAYHGDTAGAMSISGIERFKGRFSAITFETRCLGDAVDETEVAAFIVEPLVQAAAGMRTVPAHKYESLRRPSALLIVDEIATGFGRTGTMFASEQLGLQPDMICLGKSITGGALPLSATMVSERLYDAFLGPSEAHRQLFHGHSYAGNPIACAAALANIELFEQERSLEHVTGLIPALHAGFNAFRASPAVREVRSAGLMCGIEVDPKRVRAQGDALRAGWSVADALYDRGYFTRPIGDVIQFIPPLSTSAAEIDGFCAALREAVSD